MNPGGSFRAGGSAAARLQGQIAHGSLRTTHRDARHDLRGVGCQHTFSERSSGATSAAGIRGTRALPQASGRHERTLVPEGCRLHRSPVLPLPHHLDSGSNQPSARCADGRRRTPAPAHHGIPPMQTKKERNLQLAHAVLAWNRRYLHKDSTLSEALIGECFAETFIVEPNGRRYEASRRTYREFLDAMKGTMASIQYRVMHAVADEESVALSMQVEIRKSDDTIENYVAMLLMAFDAFGKVSLWHEVYVQQE